MDKRNLFQLLVELSFFNGMEEETQSFYSQPFLMRSKPRPDNGNKKRKLGGECQGENPNGFLPKKIICGMQ